MWQKLALAAAALVPLAGCASGAPQPAPSAPAPAVATQSGQSNIFGAAATEYTLVTIDGHLLPYAPPAAADAPLLPTEVLSGTLTLKPNGAFVLSTTYREALTKPERKFDSKFSGACAPEGGSFRMYWDGGGDTQLVVSGDTVTVNNYGVLFRYLKRS